MYVTHCCPYLDYHVILHASISLCPSSIEQKLAITFDDALNKIVASRVLVGHLYWRTLDFSPALKELEPTCPTLWDYETAKESLDNEVSPHMTTSIDQ